MGKALGFFIGALYVLAAVAQPLPVEQFFKRSNLSQLKISPDGKSVAGIVSGKRDGLSVVNIDTHSGRPVTNFGDADVLQFYWINDRRLIFSVGDAHEATANAYYYGWWAVDLDGSRLEEISTSNHSANTNAATPTGSRLSGGSGAPVRTAFSVEPRTRLRYLASLHDDSNDVLLEATIGNKASVWRWDTLTNQRVADLTGEVTGVQRWIIDKHGMPRAVRVMDAGREKVLYREAGGDTWQRLADAEETRLPFWPLGIDADDKTFYVGAYDPESGRSAVYRYDFAAGRVGERVARHLDSNMSGLIFSRAEHRLLGFRYEGMNTGVIWVDEHHAKVQAMASRAVPQQYNNVSIADRNPKRALIATYSDRAPSTYYLLDTEKMTMERFSSSRPWINPQDMSPRKLVRYRARDGLMIPAHLTIPKGTSGKNLPLVVEIHGGPWIQKQDGSFNLHAQFFASRGYAVLQPDFRGTQGYGQKHFEASFGEWGYSMQDDITDGVEWLIKQGIADKNRICLFGGSYGGYATLWGLIKTPDLYRCGVAYVAVSDISYMFDFNRWDWGRAEWQSYGGAKRMIGDPVRDAEKFRAVSPVENAERLKAPVLLAYGGVDQRVPIKNGTAMRAALDRYGKTYEWVVYDEEGHGFNDDKNKFDFYRRVEAFLKKYLGE